MYKISVAQSGNHLFRCINQCADHNGLCRIALNQCRSLTASPARGEWFRLARWVSWGQSCRAHKDTRNASRPPTQTRRLHSAASRDWCSSLTAIHILQMQDRIMSDVQKVSGSSWWGHKMRFIDLYHQQKQDCI